MNPRTACRVFFFLVATIAWPQTFGMAFPAEKVVEALHRAYPERIVETRFQQGAWSLRIDDIWFDWQEGRLTPESSHNESLLPSPYPFYPYQLGAPDDSKLTADDGLAIEIQLNQRLKAGVARDSSFLDVLWKAGSEEASLKTLETHPFLGRAIRIHHLVARALREVEIELQNARRDDPAVEAYLSSIAEIGSWSWRPIQRTTTRSYHSYGVAIDIIPKGIPERQLYWLWARSDKPGWYLPALHRRFVPPPQVIEIFERYGFLWGGKWRLFDSMHFEYRPEILILNGAEVKFP